MAIHVEMWLGANPEEITAALEGLVAQNLEQIRVAELAGRPYPPLYASDVRYRREPKGRERWDSIEVVFANGEGDCEDLSCTRTAQLQCDGEPARAICVRTSRKTFHILVQRATGELEDPSRIMLWKEKTMKQVKPRICVRDLGTHYIGALDLPLTSGQRLQAAEIGFDPWSALQKVMHTISAIVSNPAVASVLPPQAVLAITIADKIASMSPAGLRALIEHPGASPAQKKLAKAVVNAKEVAQKEQEVSGWGDVLTAAVSPVVWAAAEAAKAANAALHAKSGSTAPTGGGGVRVLDRTYNPAARAAREGTRTRVGPGMQQPVPTDPYGIVDQYGQPVPPFNPYNPYQPMPPQYPMPYPGQYPPPYPMPQQYPMYPPGWEGAFGQAQPLSLDEAAAVALWGAQDFAAGSFPGYAGQQPGPQPGYSQGYPGVPGYYQPPYW